MIYFFYGSDIEKVRTKAFEWVAKARAKEPNLAYVRLTREELTDGALTDAASAGGLFVSRLLVLIDDPYPPARGAGVEDEESEGFVNPTSDVGFTKPNMLDEHLEALAASNNAIIILAPALAAAKAKKIVGLAKVEYQFDATTPRRSATRGFNSALVDALGAKNRERLWLELHRALAAGDAPEMLHGLLHWKARDLMDLPAGRQGRGSAWSPAEARELSLALIALLQSSRRSGLALPLALEKFALSL